MAEDPVGAGGGAGAGCGWWGVLGMGCFQICGEAEGGHGQEPWLGSVGIFCPE